MRIKPQLQEERVNKKKTQKAKPVQAQLSEADDLRIYAAEAELVNLMTRHEGWRIISRDLEDYREKIGSKIAYLNPKTTEFQEARIIYISSDKLLKMIEDYAENRKRAVELLHKIDNTQENIILDVDNG